MVKRWRQRSSSFYRASWAMGSICHADAAQTPSGHCAVSLLIHEGVGFASSALGLLFSFLTHREGSYPLRARWTRHCPIPSWEELKSLESVVCEARQAAIKSSVQVFFSLRRDPTSGALLKKGPLELDIEEWVDMDRTSLAHVIKRNWSGTPPASKRAFRLASSCLHLLTSFGVSYKFTCHINSVVTRHGGACLQSQNSDGWGRRIEFEVWSCIEVWD